MCESKTKNLKGSKETTHGFSDFCIIGKHASVPSMKILTDFFVLESWLTAAKSQGKTIMSSAVCHDSKTKKFFNFQENLNEGK
jgi:hypothetical protein